MRQTVSRLIMILSCTALISSCNPWDSSSLDDLDVIDRDASLNRSDFRDMRNIESFKKDEVANANNIVEPPIPDLAEILTAPPKPKIGETKLVSLAVTDDVPLKDVLFELARLAKVDIDVDAGITGGVSLRATDRPFNEVIDRIADMAGLRYNMKNGVLRIERDTPYIQLYSLDLLNNERSSSASISTGTIAGSSTGGGNNTESSNSGSQSNITSKADSDFWKKFEAGIAQILSYTPAKRSSAVASSSHPAPAAPASGDTEYDPSITPLQSQVTANPTSNSSISQASDTSGNKVFYVVNRQASTLTVAATERQHKLIKKFLKKIEKNTSSQVLIEAKVVEVNLNDTYRSGIDWNNFGGKSINFSQSTADTVSSSIIAGVPTLTLLKNDILSSGVNLSSAVKLLNEFGTVRALSSPRLNAVNNQQAVLSFVEDIVYYDVDLTSTPSTTTGTVTTPGTVTATSERRTEPVGIILNLQPSINTDSGEVTLSIRPTIKRFVKFVQDPGFKINLALATQTSGLPDDVLRTLSQVTSESPQIETRELDSIVKIKSGQTLVIGGLLEDKISNTDSGVPYASEIPLFGNLFKSVDKQNSKKELVIFIRATIIGSNGSATSYDKSLYQKFIQDPRPLEF
ncbi:MAG: secretin N-terminal domain-containing protein [Rickettsiales bacterium]